jgi:Polyketide cyclase / dehydrase and lipid transport
MLKFMLLGIAVVIAGILVYAATRPDTFRVQRTVNIKAPPERIFPLIDDLRSGERWSPYYRKDPAMQGTYSGPASGVGATFNFAGNKDVGSGRVSITGTRPLNQVTMRLQMVKPFAADNTVEFTLVPGGESTDVTWAMVGRQPYLAKVMCLFFDMDKMIGTDFAAGLANLKTIAEAPIAIAQGEKA